MYVYFNRFSDTILSKSLTPHLLPFVPLFDPSIETTPYIYFSYKASYKINGLKIF